LTFAIAFMQLLMYLNIHTSVAIASHHTVSASIQRIDMAGDCSFSQVTGVRFDRGWELTPRRRDPIKPALPLKKRVPAIMSPLFPRFTEAKTVPGCGAWADARGIWPTDSHIDIPKIFMCVANSKYCRLIPIVHFLREGLLSQRFWELYQN
jgi:hypothetical protein